MMMPLQKVMVHTSLNKMVNTKISPILSLVFHFSLFFLLVQIIQTEKEPNLFKMNVGNLPPGKEVNISLTYVAELEFVEGSVN